MGMIGNSLAQGLISGANIQDGTVDTPDIKDSAVTAAKIASAVITPAKLSTGAPTWDTSSNFGIGTTLSAWGGSAGSGVLQFKNGGSLFANTSKNVYLNANVYYDGTNNKYIASGYATQFSMLASSGAFVWSSANTGSADGVITFGTAKMVLGYDGNLLLGTESNVGTISGTNLVINSSAANKISFGISGTAKSYVYADSGQLAIGYPSGGTLDFQIAGGGTPMKIDSSGRVSINTTTASGLLTINNNSSDGTSDYTQGLVFSNNVSGAGPWTHAAIWAVGASGYNGNLLFGVDGDGNNNRTGVTERARLTSAGIFSAGDVPAYLNLGYFRFNLNKIEGTQIFCISAYSTVNEDSARFYSTNGSGASASATGMMVGKNSSTNRSINAAGTINASGADYAEYMTKASDFTIAKGDVVGVDQDGKLTNAFADAVSFVVKSTDPSYVGGDTWFTEKQPVDEEMKDVVDGPIYDEWVDRREAARALVDRIAFAGQVPVNVTGATPGQYIVPVDDNGAIKGEAVSNPTFEQYQLAVGKVIAIEQDGRARIIVKVA